MPRSSSRTSPRPADVLDGARTQTPRSRITDPDLEKSICSITRHTLSLSRTSCSFDVPARRNVIFTASVNASCESVGIGQSNVRRGRGRFDVRSVLMRSASEPVARSGAEGIGIEVKLAQKGELGR